MSEVFCDICETDVKERQGMALLLLSIKITE